MTRDGAEGRAVESYRTARPPDWSRQCTLYQVNVRQFTREGTFRAFSEHLPRLKDLGVSALWLLPIHPIGWERRKGTLGSYYAVTDYRRVNPEFGTARDLTRLVRRAHRLGIKVLLDWVANHTAWDHPWIHARPERYRRDSDSRIMSPVRDWTDVAQLDTGEGGTLPRRGSSRRELWEELWSAMEHWVERHDVDGFRCDVASFVPLRFWQEARRRLARRKELFWIAEADDPRMHDRAFHATYCWTLQRGLDRVAAGEASARDLQRMLARDLQSYPRDAYRMHFTSNHDVNSWHGSETERLGPLGSEAGAALTFLLPGIPSIYSGQESANPRRLAFFDKDEIRWRPHRITGIYQRLAALRSSCPLLGSGAAGAPLRFVRSGRDDVLALVREDPRGSLLGIFRLGDGDGPVTLRPRLTHTAPLRLGIRVSSGGAVPAGRGSLEVRLGPFGFAVWA